MDISNLPLLKEQIQIIPLENYSQNVTDTDASKYFPGDAGKEIYRLLAYFSLFFQNKNIIDIGTYKGCSALALSYNKKNIVHSFDIVNKFNIIPVDNIKFYHDDILNGKHNELILSAPLMYLDTNHDGKFEISFYQFLIDNKYNGYLILDDIFLNNQMKDFWNNIKLKKIDLTIVGHWSGTGMVEFKGIK